MGAQGAVFVGSIEWYHEDERSSSPWIFTASRTSEGSGVDGEGERDAVAVVGADMTKSAGNDDHGELKVTLENATHVTASVGIYTT